MASVMNERVLAVVAHFDRGDQIDEYFRFLIQQLGEVADEILVVSASDVSDAEASVLGPGVKLKKRKNLGYDFGSWKDGLSVAGDLSKYDVLILANDSFYAARHCFSRLFNKMSGICCDFWGVTESWEFERHLQSYLLVFKPACFCSEAFKDFWSNWNYFQEKDEVILKGEIGLSRALRQAGFMSASAFTPTFRDKILATWRISARTARFRIQTGKRAPMGWGWQALKELLVRVPTIGTLAYNPTHLLWDRVIAKGARLIKIELLRSNPVGVNLSKTRQLLFEEEFPVPLIEAHLSRVYNRRL